MKLKSDEQRALIALASGKRIVGSNLDRRLSILSKFHGCGFTNPDNSLTQRGLHIAASLNIEQEQNGDVQGSDRARVDSKPGPRDSGRDQAEASDRDCESTERSDAATANRPDDSCGSDARDMPGADTETGADSGAVREAVAVPAGRDVVGG